MVGHVQSTTRVYGAFTAMPVHTFENKPLVMSHYWYALESVRGHSVKVRYMGSFASR